MQKTKHKQPRKIHICFDIYAGDNVLSVKDQNRMGQRNQSKFHQSNASREKYVTNTSSKNPEEDKSIIRLGSMKKKYRKSFKQNTQKIFFKAQQAGDPEKKTSNSSMDKYFKSLRSSIRPSTQHFINISDFNNGTAVLVQKQEENDKSQIIQNKWTINIETAKNLQANRRKLSQSKSMKNVLERRSSNKVKASSLNKRLKTNTQQLYKLAARLQRIKQYRFVSEHLSDLQLQGIFNQLQMANVPEVRWAIIIVDMAYQIIRRKQNNYHSQQITRNL